MMVNKKFEKLSMLFIFFLFLSHLKLITELLMKFYVVVMILIIIHMPIPLQLILILIIQIN